MTSIGEHPVCAATRKDGTPCAARALPGGRFCFAHDPDRQEGLRASREKGGRGKASAARLERLVPESLRPLIATLLDAVGEVHAGTLDPRAASAMAALAGAVTRAYSVGVLEQRVEELERATETSRRAV